MRVRRFEEGKKETRGAGTTSTPSGGQSMLLRLRMVQALCGLLAPSAGHGVCGALKKERGALLDKILPGMMMHRLRHGRKQGRPKREGKGGWGSQTEYRHFLKKRKQFPFVVDVVVKLPSHAHSHAHKQPPVYPPTTGKRACGEQRSS
jgi:hypothetical protein